MIIRLTFLTQQSQYQYKYTDFANSILPKYSQVATNYGVNTYKTYIQNHFLVC